jgi:hypothetical protein
MPMDIVANNPPADGYNMRPATGANLVDMPVIWPKTILKHHFGV